MAKGKRKDRNARFRKGDEARGRGVLARQRAEQACSGLRNDGRMQGFLAGMGLTALAWIWIAQLRKANV